MPRSLIIISVIAASLSVAETAYANRMTHRPPELSGMGSRQPVPIKHVACMRIVDNAISKIVGELESYGPLPPNRDRYKPEGFARAQQIQRETTAKMITIHERLRGKDWGVPPRALAVEGLARFRKDVDRLNRELSDLETEHAADAKAASSDVFAEINRRRENGVRFQLIGYKSLVRFAECVIANNLPGTTDSIPE